jgi:hypothetical protein
MRPILDSSSFVPVRTLHCRNFPHSASSFLAFHISFHTIAVFVFRKPLFISLMLPYLCMLHEYHVIYRIWCSVLSAVLNNRGSYLNVLPCITGHTCSRGHPTGGCPPASGSGKVLKTPTVKEFHFPKHSHRNPRTWTDILVNPGQRKWDTR